MIKKGWFEKIKLRIFTLIVKYKSKNTYPETLEVSLENLLGKQRKLKVAIIDDESFPWVDALESRGAKVTHFNDYCKPTTQVNQKTKIIDFSSFDIIICDVRGVGSTIYPDLDGVGVMEDLRNKYLFHVIIAYTGNPGAISSKLKKNDCLDMIFVKDWALEDFLLNYDKLAEVFKYPAARWKFIRKRLSHLDIGEKEIEMFRRSFVEDVLLINMLREKFKWSPEQTKELILKSSKRDIVECDTLVKFGLTGLQITKILMPFLGGK
ncbi:response regulator [Acinetobacter guillouiae]|uniref:response regulator n=1 Tax=Acinetobacter guillouiae TaxID=106649 RepID=UPI001AE4EE2E|nr:response regulator [Acinetobacter guillouiae]MBP2544641.1 hypothetical protein [Acinetobacter guillouiae]